MGSGGSQPSLGWIGDYEVLRQIGAGGFASVYEAKHPQLGPVAIKLLDAHHAEDSHLRERFVQEARVLRQVSCGAVVAIHEIGEASSGQPYLVLDFADRGDLARRLLAVEAQGDRPTLADVQRVGDTLASSLRRMHALRIVHRDVKPANLLIFSAPPQALSSGECLLSVDEDLRLGDFGLAKDLFESSGLTRGAGTPGFSAPEQQVMVGTVDHRADIYSASAVLYRIVTGSNPSASIDHSAATLSAHSDDEAFNSGLLAGLAPLADDRFDSIDDWYSALFDRTVRRRATRWTGVPTLEAAPPPAALPAQLGSKRHRGSVGIAVGAVLAVAGLGVGYVTQQQWHSGFEATTSGFDMNSTSADAEPDASAFPSFPSTEEPAGPTIGSTADVTGGDSKGGGAATVTTSTVRPDTTSTAATTTQPPPMGTAGEPAVTSRPVTTTTQAPTSKSTTSTSPPTTTATTALARLGLMQRDTVCGEIKIYDSDTPGWRNVGWTETPPTVTDRMFRISEMPWRNESAADAGTLSQGATFPISVSCINSDGRVLSGTYTVR